LGFCNRFISSTILITSFISKDKLVEFRWVCGAIILGIAYAWIKWFKNEINYLKNEVKKLKENVNREEIIK